MTTSIATGVIALSDSRATARVLHCRSRIEFHHAGEIRDRLRARQRQDHPYKLHPDGGQALVPRLEKVRGEMRRAERY